MANAIRVVIMLALLAPAIYFSTSYTKFWFDEAKVASAEITELEPNFMEEIVVCSSKYIDSELLAQNGTLREAFSYGFGEFVNARTSAFLEGDPEANRTEDRLQKAATIAKWKESYDSLGLSGLELMQEVSGFRFKLLGHGSYNKSVILPNFIDPQVGCAPISSAVHYKNGLTGLNNLPFSMESRRVFGFTLPGTSSFFTGEYQDSMYISLFKSQNLSLVNLRSDFLRIDPVEGGLGNKGKITRIQITLEPAKFKRLSTGRDPCFGKDFRDRFPKDMRETACDVICEDHAYATHYNCSILNAITPEYSELPTCNQFKKGPTIESMLKKGVDDIVETKDGCLIGRRCRTRTYCEEFSFNYLNIEMREFEGPTNTSLAELKMFDVYLNTKRSYTMISEELLVTTEGWIGIVGGILGIWVGWSFVTCVDWLEGLWKRCRKGKGEKKVGLKDGRDQKE